MDVQALPLQNIGGDLFPALDDPLVRGDGDEILGPVHVLDVAQSRQVVNIVGVVIIGKEAAGAVKALHQHPLPVHVGEAQRAVDLRAAQLTGPVLHRLEQGGGYLPVVDEVHLRETQAVGTPLVVGLTAEDGTDAAHQRAVIPAGQPATGLAVAEGGVFLTVPVCQIVAVCTGDVLGNVSI